jgi:hypothetical protein
MTKNRNGDAGGMKNKALDMLFDRRKQLLEKYEGSNIVLGLIDTSLEEFEYLQKQSRISREMQETHEHLNFISRVINLVRNINETNQVAKSNESQKTCETK